MRRMLVIAVISMMTMFSTVSGADDDGPVIMPINLASRTFILEEVDGNPFQSERQPFIEFDQDLRISGAMCNPFNGPATLEDGVLKAERLISTRMMCPDNSLSMLESRFHRNMDRGIKVNMDGHRLIFTSADGSLVFSEKPNPDFALDLTLDDLRGNKYYLRNVNGDEIATNGPRPFIEFGHDGRVVGLICNNFSGMGTLENNRLTVEQAATTMKLCLDESLNQAEQLLHGMIKDGAIISRSGSILILTNSDDTMVFESE